MHHYIKYFFVIFGSISILQGSNNNNNQYYKCLLCGNTEGQGEKLRNGNLQGIYRDTKSFNCHFDRKHLDVIHKGESIFNHLQKFGRFDRDRINFKLQFAKEINPGDSSPLLTPIGSPILEHSNPHSSDDSAPALKEKNPLKKNSKQLIDQSHKRRQISIKQEKSQAFPEDDYKKETAKKVKKQKQDQNALECAAFILTYLPSKDTIDALETLSAN